jgi:hypothetical protein
LNRLVAFTHNMSQADQRLSQTLANLIPFSEASH